MIVPKVVLQGHVFHAESYILQQHLPKICTKDN
jgi:hypothetical protein